MRRLLSLLIFITATGFFAYSSCGTTDVSDTPNEEFNLEPSEFTEINRLNKVNMRVEEDTISPTGLTLLFENSENKNYTYGEAYTLETKINKAWYQVPIEIEEDYGFLDIGYNLPANGTAEWTVDWEWLYGDLDAGDYRIVKDIIDVQEAGDYELFLLAAEFTVE